MKTINVCVLLLLISLTSKFVQAQTNGQAWTWREYSHGGNIIRELFQVEVKNAVLVIEPHGAYAELSVYLEYYKTGGNLSTLFQQFTLPPGSVINDYWLWKNNFVIQGCVFEIWPGPSGSLKWPFDTPGPSQLLQSEDQFKLSVKFSDRSFQTIRIKYNFITPMQWEGNHAMFNLPLNLISGGSGNYPLEILFRSADSKWNTPTIQGLQNLVFYDRIDTLGFHYKKAHIHNIKSNTSLRFQIDHQLPDGVLFSNLRSSNDANYFQFGILPSKAFNLNSSDVPSQKSVVAIDLTSDYNKPFPEFFNNISNVLDSAFLAQDSMRMLIAGAGRVKEITENWTKFSHESMNAIIDTFLHSSYGDSVKNQPKLNTIYTDLQAGSTLSMGNLFPYSNYTSFPDFTAARSQISRADRVISYNYNSLTFGDRLEIKASIDSLLEKGGRFIVYANQQRLGIDSLLLSYIPSLQFKMLVPESIWLYRPEGGNLHDEFPPQIINHRINFFSFNDPTFRTELVDDAGNACLISKKTSTGGLIIITGMDYRDGDNPIARLQFNKPLYGVNDRPQMIGGLLEQVKNICTSGRVSTVLVFSNSDSLCTKSTTNTYVKTYLNLFTKPAPVFKAFNLLDHTQGYPDSVTIGSISYSGAGYLLQDLAEKSNGSFFAPRPFNWTAIPYLLKPKAFPSVDSMKVAIQVFGLNDTLLSLQKVSPKLYQENAPNFFLGSLSSGQSISITADTWLEGNQPVRSKSFVFPVRQDTSRMINPLRSMLGNEQLLDSVNKTSVNFVNLINIAKKYHLLSDYTGMQILQGNDTLIAIVDPFDETQLAPVEKKNVIYDSLSLAVYPNPFNSMASIIVKLNNLSSFNVFVYDMLGRSVKTIVTIDQFKGKMKAFWDGKDASGKPVATGIYFLMLKGSEVATGKRFLLTQKIIYLK